MPDSIYQITGDLSVGIDFFGIQVDQAESSASGQLSVSVSATKVKLVSSSINVTSNLLISGTEFQYERVVIASSVSLSVSAKKIVKVSSATSGSASTSFNAIKLEFSSVQISISSNAVIVPREILKAKVAILLSSNTSVQTKRVRKVAVSISSSSNTIFTAKRIKTISVSISGMLTKVVVFQEVNYAQSSISIASPIFIVNLIKFKQNNVIDTSNYKTLFVLDGSPLTNQGRTLSSDMSQVINENKNWNNSKTRYYKRSNSSGRKTFNLSWTYLPSSRHDTADLRHARDFLKRMASDPDVHTLKVLNEDSSGVTPYTETQYNVFIRDYTESLLRRDLVNDVYYWDCNMTLEEV